MRMIMGLMLVLLPVLAACKNVVIVGEPVFGQLYTVDDFDYATRNGELITRIGDDPFGGPHAEFSARVTDLMFGANIGGDVVFTPSPRGAGSGRYHVVVLFNPPISADEWDFCAPNADVPTLEPTNALRLVASFCHKETLLSTANGKVFGVRSMHAPLFRKLVRQVTLALFPASDDLDIGGDSANVSN